MASRRKRTRTLANVVKDIENRAKVTQRRPAPTRIKRNAVTGDKLVPRTVQAKAIEANTITTAEVAFGTVVYSNTQPTTDLKAGTFWVDSTDNTAAVYDVTTSAFVDVAAVDTVARTSANGKNTIYRQTSQPTGGTYVTGDVWFDTDDDNKIYRYDGSSWVGFTLGNNALASISANKITAGTIDASVITVSNLDAGNITTGTLTGRTIRTSSSGRRVEVDSSSNALSFYNSSGTALGHIRPASDYAGVIISAGGSATTDFVSAAYPKLIMYPAGSDGQFTLILDNLNGGLSLSSSGGKYTATIGATNTEVIIADPYGNRSFREIGIGTAANFPDLASIQTVTGQEGLIALTYS